MLPHTSLARKNAPTLGSDLLLYVAGLPPALLFFVMGTSHFAHPELFEDMIPFLPFPRFLVYLTGLLQLVGSLGMSILPLVNTAAAAKCNLAMLLLVMSMAPANIYVVYNDLPIFGHRLQYSWRGHGLHLVGLLTLGVWLSALAYKYNERPPLVENIFRGLQSMRRPSARLSADVLSTWQPLQSVMEETSRSS